MVVCVYLPGFIVEVRIFVSLFFLASYLQIENFAVPSLAPSKAYYAFLQFDALRRCGQWCASEQGDGVYTLAATGNGDLLCAANITPDEKKLDVILAHPHGKKLRVFLTDQQHDNAEVLETTVDAFDGFLLPGYSFITIEIK